VTRSKAAIVSLLLCLACATATLNSAAAQTAKTNNGIRLRLSGRRVVVKERGRGHALDIWKHVEAARIADAREIFLTRKGEFIYLLLQVCGPSKAKPDDHECGAGDECDLIWLKLNGAWRERDAASEHYESCWLPITSDEGPKVSGRRLVLVLDDLRDWVRREVDYDADRPEEGLTFKFWAIPKKDVP
jgi:hypothetical protein